MPKRPPPSHAPAPGVQVFWRMAFQGVPVNGGGGGNYAETAIWCSRLDAAATHWVVNGLPTGRNGQHVPASLVRSLAFEACYRQWRWSSSLPDFAWELVSREASPENIVLPAHLPAGTRRRFCALLQSLSSICCLSPRTEWEHNVGEDPPEDGVDDDEVIHPHSVTLSGFTLAAGGQTLSVVYFEHYVIEPNMNMRDESLCLACGLGGEAPIVLAKWRCACEAPVTHPAHVADHGAMEALLARLGLEGESHSHFIALLLSVFAADPIIRKSIKYTLRLRRRWAEALRPIHCSCAPVTAGGYWEPCEQRGDKHDDIRVSAPDVFREYTILVEVKAALPTDAQRKAYQQYLLRSTAFLMCQHPRLGKSSPASCLPDASLPIVATLLREHAREGGGGGGSIQS